MKANKIYDLSDLKDVPILGKQANTLTPAQLDDLDKWFHQIGNNIAKLLRQVAAGHGVLQKMIAENKK